MMSNLVYLILVMISFEKGNPTSPLINERHHQFDNSIYANKSDSTVSDCLKTIVAIENEIHKKRSTLGNSVSFLHYKVRTVDWEDVTVKSEVKLYQNSESLHMFASQADLFSNSVEYFLILKDQSFILANSVKEANSQVLFDDEERSVLRNQFLQSCKIESCVYLDSTKGIRKLILSIDESIKPYLEIRKMSYTYNEQTNKLLRNTVVYSKKYKIKRLEMDYMEYKMLASYNFSTPSKLVLNRKGGLLEKYKNYEFIDDRK